MHVHRNSHTRMCRTCFNHIASQWNSDVWMLTSRQRYCSSLELQRWCVKNWGLKSYENCTDYCECMYAHGNLEYTHTKVTNAMPTVYTILDYEYRHKNKDTGLILVPRKCVVYKWDQKCYRNKVCTSCTGLISRKGI